VSPNTALSPQEIADRSLSVAALRTAPIAADEASELAELSYSVAHDLRAPLRAIDGFSRILFEDHADRLDAEGQRILGVVRENAAKMGRMIDDILVFSRLGDLDMHLGSVDMAALVDRTLAEESAPAFAARDLSFKIGKLPAVQGDEAMLQRVWMNLLDNAIKFTAPKPHARIEIGATAGKGETIYYVRDNGVGFDMRRAGRLFGLFQRLHGNEFPGTEGKVGEGATVYFTLPTRETSHD